MTRLCGNCLMEGYLVSLLGACGLFCQLENWVMSKKEVGEVVTYCARTHVAVAVMDRGR